mgnify:CR=1 FL=1
MKTSVFFNKINNWNDFNNALIPLNNKEKGDAFELLTKLYFLIDHKYDNYDNIWLLSEVPKKELEIIVGAQNAIEKKGVSRKLIYVFFFFIKV